MKKKNLVAIVAIIGMTVFSAYSQGNKSNGTLEIVSVNIPDSIVFTPSSEVEIETGKLEVFLVSGLKTLQTGLSAVSAPGGLKMYVKNGEFVSAFTDKTTFYVKNFDIPADFKAEKIKFVVEGKEMYYNLAKSEWEK